MLARRLSLLWFLLTLIHVPALCQESPWPLPDDPFPVKDPTRAVISGFVRIAGGEQRVASNIAVKLESSTSNQVGIAFTGNSGRFDFYNLYRGPYFIVIEVAGYKKVRYPVEYYYAIVDGILIYLEPEEEEEEESATGALVSARQLQVPEKAHSEFEKGRKAASQKKLEDSIKHLRKAVELFPDYDEAYVQLALMLTQKKDYALAQQVSETALRAYDKNASAHALLGVAHREQQRLPEAQKALEESVRLEESSWFAHLELCKVYARQGRMDQAHEQALRAHQLNSNIPSVHLTLYNILILLDRYDDALTEIEEFIDFFPQHRLASQARQQRARLEQKLGAQR